MKVRAAFLFILVIVIVAIGLWMFSPNPARANAKLEMRSDPFPLAIGWVTLTVAVLNGDGQPIDNAAVAVSIQMMHPGMLPIHRQATPAPNGLYEVSINWPMMGQWVVDVAAELPGTQDTLQDQFEVFVYPVPVNSSTITSFRSASEIEMLVTDAERELHIVIPQGTQAMMRLGQAENMMPDEIRLNINGQNTLVIQNNDIVEHTIGPFLVRPGEVIRQKFTSPSVYQGICSLNVAESISIIVEG